ALRELKSNFDVAFIALHGKFGEDGSLQSLLERNKISFTGSGIRASKLAMDKCRSDRVFQKAGLLVPKSVVLQKSQK
ncbi:MAG: D-alanine--D-alanine ligase, partial [Patescibacteria group bacterium]